MSEYAVSVRCVICDDTFEGHAPSLAWLGRHAHGKQTVGYFAQWGTNRS